MTDIPKSLQSALEHHKALQSAIEHHRAGRLGEARAICQQLLQAKPDHHRALHLLGLIAEQQGNCQGALELLKRAVQISPSNAACYHNLGSVYNSLKRPDDALACYEKALALQPNDAETINNLGHTHKDHGNIDAARASYLQAIAIRPDYVEAYNNWLMISHYLENMPLDARLSEHLKFAERFEAPLKSRWRPHPNSRDPSRRLKIGYVSPDFRNHAVAYFIEPVIAHHDKLQFEVFCYYNHVRHDSFTDLIRAAADHWLPCQYLSDDQLAERIRADGIDILVDLAGHTSLNRLLVFARKPAPVQVTYLGYVDTTGLSAMDYRLTHADADPPGNDAYYSEKLYRLPGNFWWCYRPRPNMPDVSPPPVLTNGYVTFGSTNTFPKLSSEALALWAEVLRAVPDARLLVAAVPEGSARGAFLERFATQGIDTQRLIIHDRMPAVDFWSLHRHLDIVLDPFPHNGGTTTCDAMWLGVPVVSLTGQAFVSRMGHALLKNIGLPELAAANKQEYVDIAVRLANDTERLKTLRSGMRARLLASGLCDAAGFTHHLEAAYREMWRGWCGS